jgi:hypothetical protein
MVDFAKFPNVTIFAAASELMNIRFREQLPPLQRYDTYHEFLDCRNALPHHQVDYASGLTVDS